MRGNELALEAERVVTANDAIHHFQAVIDSYRRIPSPEGQLREMAAWAYYGAGIVYQVTGRPNRAQVALKQALALTENADLIARAERRLSEVGT